MIGSWQVIWLYYQMSFIYTQIATIGWCNIEITSSICQFDITILHQFTCWSNTGVLSLDLKLTTSISQGHWLNAQQPSCFYISILWGTTLWKSNIISYTMSESMTYVDRRNRDIENQKKFTCGTLHCKKTGHSNICLLNWLKTFL